MGKANRDRELVREMRMRGLCHKFTAKGTLLREETNCHVQLNIDFVLWANSVRV